MVKKTKIRSFDEVLAELGNQRFDVAGAQEGASAGAGRKGGAVRVSKYGCAAEIMASNEGPAMMLTKPGWVMGGEISRLVDKGLPEVYEELAAGDSGDGGYSAGDPRFCAGAGPGDGRDGAV